MNLTSLVHDKYDEFVSLCPRHKVDKIYAFESSVTDRFDPQKSDIDLVVKLNIEEPMDYGETLLSFWDELEFLFNRKIDLLTDESICNPYLKKSIESTKRLIYDGQGEKVLV